MKGQILSRIQSYQNIPIHPQISNPKISSTQTVKLYNESKFSKYASIERESPNKILKMESPPPKLPGQRFFTSNESFSSNKKSLTTISKDIKRSLNSEIKDQNREVVMRNTRIVKRLSDKYLPFRSIEKSQEKDLDIRKIKNSPNFEIIKTNSYQKINSDLLKEVNRNNSARRKELMIMYGKGNRSAKSSITSEQTIKVSNDVQDVDINKGKNMNEMMKTINVFKDYKKNPYFNLSHKKINLKCSNPAISLSRIPNFAFTEKSEVSIELMDDENLEECQKEEGENFNKNMLEFGCSEIKETEICNDSSFLEEDQKNLISEIEIKTGISKKEDVLKRKWKKLPNDFLKN